MKTTFIFVQYLYIITAIGFIAYAVWPGFVE